jgi:hypothetical protein
MAAGTNDAGHRWRFYRIGGLDQVALETADDLANLEHLDQKLWVALSCPVKGLELDERTLTLLDLDQDGRVRAPEIVAALRWCGARLKAWGPSCPARPPCRSTPSTTPRRRGRRCSARPGASWPAWGGRRPARSPRTTWRT